MLSPLAVLFTSSCLTFSPMEAVAFSSGKQGRVQVFDSREGLTRHARAALFGVENDNDFDACTTNFNAEDFNSNINSNSNININTRGVQHVQSRRRMMSSIAAGVLTSGLVTRHIKHAFAEYANAATPPASFSSSVFGTADHPVAIVGGSGRTGMAVAESIADPAFGNMHAVTLSRSGKDPFQIIKLPEATKEKLKHRAEPFDVRESQETILANLREVSPSVVVYAASASRQGGNVFQVDDLGVEKVAQACKEMGALFVLISALAVDRPDSKSYQITNTLGGNYQGIMDAKNNGEAKTRKIFASKGASNQYGYVIVRPGVLLNGKSTTGPAGLELNQGDTIGGGLSRDELAGVVIGAIQSKATAKKNKNGITVEAYRKSTAQTLEKKYPKTSGNELTVDASLVAETPASSRRLLYQELFANAKTDQIG